VNIINTDGMALIGPGSEWFWTALTGVILAITFLAIYRQLSTARSAAVFEQVTQLEAELRSERMIRMQLDILVSLRNGTDPADLPNFSTEGVGAYWERVGGLVRRGHLDAQLLWDGSGHIAQAWWILLESSAHEVRARTGRAAYFEHFEWLAGVMADLSRRRGSRPYDRAYLMSNLDRFIADNRASLQLDAALRTVSTGTP